MQIPKYFSNYNAPSLKPYLNLGIRTISLVLKFLFLLFLGKYSIDESNLGVYGIFNSSIGFSIYLIGFEYYVYISRAIAQDKSKVVQIKNQVLFYIISYLLFVPAILFVVFSNDFLDVSYIWLFIIILISEHAAQECFRLLSLFKKPIKANLVLLIRNIWIIVSIIYFVVASDMDLKRFFLFWAVSSFSGLLLGIYFLSFQISFVKIWNGRINLREIWKGIGVSMYFFISSLGIQTILLSGRFFLDYHFDKAVVGIYTFYSSIVSLIEVVIYNMVVMMLFPYLLENADSDEKVFSKYVSKFKKQIYGLTVLSIAGAALLMPILLFILEKKSTSDNIIIFYIMLLGALAYNLSLIPHYIMYARKKERFILFSTLIAVILNIIVNYFFIPANSLMGASLGYTIAMVFLFLAKFRFNKKSES